MTHINKRDGIQYSLLGLDITCFTHKF